MKTSSGCRLNAVPGWILVFVLALAWALPEVSARTGVERETAGPTTATTTPPETAEPTARATPPRRVTDTVNILILDRHDVGRRVVVQNFTGRAACTNAAGFSECAPAAWAVEGERLKVFDWETGRFLGEVVVHLDESGAIAPLRLAGSWAELLAPPPSPPSGSVLDTADDQVRRNWLTWTISLVLPSGAGFMLLMWVLRTRRTAATPESTTGSTPTMATASTPGPLPGVLPLYAAMRTDPRRRR